MCVNISVSVRCLSVTSYNHPHPHRRYDASYIGAFGLRGGQGGILTAGPGASSGSGHPHLKAYLQRVYKLIAPTVDWPAFRQYYRWGPGMQPNEPLPPLAPLKAAAEAGPSRCKVM